MNKEHSSEQERPYSKLPHLELDLKFNCGLCWAQKRCNTINELCITTRKCNDVITTCRFCLQNVEMQCIYCTAPYAAPLHEAIDSIGMISVVSFQTEKKGPTMRNQSLCPNTRRQEALKSGARVWWDLVYKPAFSWHLESFYYVPGLPISPTSTSQLQVIEWGWNKATQSWYSQSKVCLHVIETNVYINLLFI